MDRIHCKLKLESFNSIRNLTRMQYAILFSKSPITHEVEQRHIFSESGAEIYLWLDHLIQKTEKYNKPYAAYVNGELYKQDGDLF